MKLARDISILGCAVVLSCSALAQTVEAGGSGTCAQSTSLLLKTVKVAQETIEKNGDRALVMSAANADRVVKLHAFDAAVLKEEQLTASYFSKGPMKFSVDEVIFEVGRVNEKGAEKLKEDLEKILKAIGQELKELSKDDASENATPEVVAQIAQMRVAGKFAKELSSSLEEQELREFLSWCKQNESWLLNSQSTVEQLVEKYSYDFVSQRGKRVIDGEAEFKGFWSRSWARVSDPVGRFMRESKKDLPKVYRRQLLKSPIKYIIPGTIAYYLANQGSVLKVKVSDEKNDLEEILSQLEKLKLEAERISKQMPTDATGERELEAFKIYARGLTAVNAKEAKKVKAQKQALTFVVQSLLASEKREAAKWQERVSASSTPLSAAEQEEGRVLFARRFLLENVFAAYAGEIDAEAMNLDVGIDAPLLKKLGGANLFISTVANVAGEFETAMKESLDAGTESEREPSSEKKPLKKTTPKRP